MRLEDRIEIYRLLGEWKTQKEIAKLVWYNQWTISRELKKKEKRRWYRPLYAENRRKRVRRIANEKQRKLEKDTAVWKEIEQRLYRTDEDRSPDTIVWRMKEEGQKHVSTSTIYRHIHRKWWEIESKLRHGRKGYRKRHTVETRGKYGQNVPRIDEREGIVELRERYGDWEVDTVVGKGRKERIVTLLERKSRYLRIGLRKWLWSVGVGETIIELLRNYSDVKTITADNGKEFGDWKRVREELGIGFYFARPYHSWERWSNENANRCLRKRLPKGTAFWGLSDEYIAKIESMINNKPRKLLKYRTPYEVFHNTSTPYFS